MSHIKIRINSLEDAKNGVPVIENATDDDVVHTEDCTIAVLEAGMQSGASSISIILKTPEGKHLVYQTSVGLFEAVAATVNGAKQRFGK